FLHINENKVIELSNIDLAGNPRVYGNSVDMGAYEHGPWVSLRDPPHSKFNIQHSKLLTVSPNPFRYGTYISYIIIEKGLLNISVYSLAGLKVKTLVSSQANPGDKGSFYWNGSDQNGQTLPAGIYLLRMTLDGKELETARAVKQ
ncbi:MAG: T9SS type A sorting domain-containing protein, partial [Bacteroidales bacterium]